MREDLKQQRREKWVKEHPNHKTLRLNKEEKKALLRAIRVKKEKLERLKSHALIAKKREIEHKTFEKIAKEVGLTRQRVQQIYKIWRLKGE